MKPLAIAWTTHCKDQESKAKFEALIRNSTISLGRLRDIVREFTSALYAQERKPDVYDTPNWAEKQAHINGMLAAYNNIDRLLSFMDKSPTDREKDKSHDGQRPI